LAQRGDMGQRANPVPPPTRTPPDPTNPNPRQPLMGCAALSQKKKSYVSRKEVTAANQGGWKKGHKGSGEAREAGSSPVSGGVDRKQSQQAKIKKTSPGQNRSG